MACRRRIMIKFAARGGRGAFKRIELRRNLWLGGGTILQASGVRQCEWAQEYEGAGDCCAFRNHPSLSF